MNVTFTDVVWFSKEKRCRQSLFKMIKRTKDDVKVQMVILEEHNIELIHFHLSAVLKLLFLDRNGGTPRQFLVDESFCFPPLLVLLLLLFTRCRMCHEHISCHAELSNEFDFYCCLEIGSIERNISSKYNK